MRLVLSWQKNVDAGRREGEGEEEAEEEQQQQQRRIELKTFREAQWKLKNVSRFPSVAETALCAEGDLIRRSDR